MLQDLREYLEENPDNAVAPDWSETVRNSVRTQDVILLQDFAVQCDLLNLYLVENVLPVLHTKMVGAVRHMLFSCRPTVVAVTVFI